MLKNHDEYQEQDSTDAVKKQANPFLLNRRQFLQLALGQATALLLPFPGLKPEEDKQQLIGETEITPLLEIKQIKETCKEFVALLDTGTLSESVPNNQPAKSFEVQFMLFPPLLDLALLQHISDNLPNHPGFSKDSTTLAVGMVCQQLIDQYFQMNPAFFSSAISHWDFSYAAIKRRYKSRNGTPVDPTRDLATGFTQMDDVRITALLQSFGQQYSSGVYRSSELSDLPDTVLGTSDTVGNVNLDLDAHDDYPFWLLYATIAHEFAHTLDLAHISTLLEYLPKNQKTAQFFNLHAQAAAHCPTRLLRLAVTEKSLYTYPGYFANSGILRHADGILELQKLASHLGSYALEHIDMQLTAGNSPYFNLFAKVLENFDSLPEGTYESFISGEYKQSERYALLPGWQQELLSKALEFDDILDINWPGMEIELWKIFLLKPHLCVLLLTGTKFVNHIPNDVLLQAHSLMYSSAVMEHFAEVYTVLMYLSQINDVDSIKILKQHEAGIVSYYTGIVNYLQDIPNLYTNMFLVTRNHVDNFFKGKSSSDEHTDIVTKLRERYEDYSNKLDTLLKNV